MAIKCSVYIAASVDGYIAKPGGDIDWLLRPEYGTAEMKGLRYEDFIATVDAIVMGRNSFEKVLSFDKWYYEGTPVIVLTSRALEIPSRLKGKVQVTSGPPEQVVARLASQGMKHLYIDGGITIQRFLQARLIHELTITWIPILLGGGIPLFGTLGNDLPLRLMDSVSSENGFVQVRYELAAG